MDYNAFRPHGSLHHIRAALCAILFGRHMKIISWLLFSCCSFVSLCLTQEKTGGSIHGLIVGDYFYKMSGDAQPFGSASQFSQPSPKDSSGFQIRRLQIAYDYVYSNEFSTRFQVEGNEKTIEPVAGRLSLYMKSAYLEWKNLVPKSSLYVGLIPTPTWINVERIWGYRSIEKTIADFRCLGSLTDIGVHLKGTLVSDWSLDYSIMIGNGNSQKPENDRERKFYGTLTWSPIRNLALEGYADYEPASANQDKLTWKAFLSYQEETLMVGTEVVQQIQKNQDLLTGDISVFGLAFFAWFQPSAQLRVFARFDYYDPNRLSSLIGFSEHFFSVGLDYFPLKGIHFSPNLWINTFTAKSNLNSPKEADVVPRVTFFFLFN